MSPRSRQQRQFLEALESRLLLSGISFDAGIPVGALYDINNDGILDSVAGGNFPNAGTNYGVSFGLGNNQYEPAVPFFGFGGAILDVSGDGMPDSIISPNGSTTLNVAFGNGDGTFTPNATYHTAGLPISSIYHPVLKAIGDLNNDGKPDLIVYNDGDNSCGALINNGSGTFQVKKLTSLPLDKTTDVVIADFDGDHFGDLAFLGGVAIGNGDGTFQAVMPMDILDNSAAGDFNGDTLADLVTHDSLTDELRIYLGGNSADLLVYKNTVALPNAGKAFFASADFNGDGFDDLIASTPGGVLSFLSSATADLTPAPQKGKIITYGSGPDAVVPLDFNGDAILDIRSGGTLFLGRGNGTFKAAISDQIFASPLVAADFNHDGRTDLISQANVPSYDFSIRLANNDGTYAAPVNFSLGDDIYGLGAAAGDINGDGDLDLLIAFSILASPSTDHFAIVLGNGDGTFQSPITFPAAFDFYKIASGDFNDDNRTDFAVVSNWTSGTGFAAHLMLSTGASFVVTPIGGFSSFNLAVADFNNDGKDDLATPGTIYFGNAAGAFPTQAPFAGSGSLLPGDFNNDGRTDLIAGATKLYLQDAAGALQLQPDISNSPSAPLRAADFDGDGFLDLVDYNARIYRNLGTATFEFVLRMPPPPNGNILPGDVNGDGKPDLINTGSYFGVVLNTTGPFATVATLSLNPVPLAYGDAATFSAVVHATDDSAVAGAVQFFIDNIKWGDPVPLDIHGSATSAAITTLTAGDHTISANFIPASDDYLPSTNTDIQSVRKVTLTVTPDPKSKIYNQPNPTLTGNLDGLVIGDNVTATFKTTATAASHPGDYPITAVYSDPQNKLQNYDIQLVPTHLTITKANQAITWTTPADIFGGDPLTTKQLNAKATHVAGGTPNGALSYDHPLGEVLPLGDTLITVTAAATQDYNEATASVTLHVKAPGPDLKLTLGNFTPTYTLVPGETIKVPVTLQNIGNQKADASKVAPIQILLRASATGVYDTNDPFLIPAILVTAPLIPGGKKITTATIKLPYDLAPGNFYITAGLVDPNVGADPNINNDHAGGASSFELQRKFGFIPGRKPTAIYSGVDADGTLFKISLAGPGNGQVNINGADIDLNITGTTAASSLTITTTKSKTPGDDGLVSIHDINAVFAGAAMNIFNAATTRLTGTFNFGSLHTLSLYSAENALISSGGIFKTLKVKTNVTSSTILSSNLATIAIGGNVTDSAFTFNGTTGSGLKIINTFSAGVVSNSVVRADGHIGTIKFTAFNNSTLFLGVLNAVTTLPTSIADFKPGLNQLPTLTSLTIGTLTHSLIAASKITTTKITTVSDLDPASESFGFATLAAGAYTGPASTGDFIDPKDSVLP